MSERKVIDLARLQVRVDVLETIATLSVQALDDGALKGTAAKYLEKALAELWAIAEDLR